MLTEENNKELVRRLYEEVISRKVLDTKNWTGAHAFSQYTSSSRPSSLKTFNRFFTGVSFAFPDFNLTIDSIIAKGDRVMVRYRIRGTQNAEFMGIAPANEPMTITGIDVFRIENGRIVEHWDAAHQMVSLPLTNSFPQPEMISNQWGIPKPSFRQYNPRQLSSRTPETMVPGG
jgi:predicted ester cyclase